MLSRLLCVECIDFSSFFFSERERGERGVNVSVVIIFIGVRGWLENKGKKKELVNY